MELAQLLKRKATTEAKGSSSMVPAVQHMRMAVDARQSDATNSAVMPHHPAVVKRSLVVNDDDDDDDNNNDVTHPAEANQKGDLKAPQEKKGQSFKSVQFESSSSPPSKLGQSKPVSSSAVSPAAKGIAQLDSDDHDSSTNDAVNSSGSILIMLPRSI
jgi:hypothetical protein